MSIDHDPDQDIINRAMPGIRGLMPYQPGKPIEELERELGIRDAVKLASNENPLGPSPLAVQALTDCASELHRYPDGGGFALSEALAEKHGVAAEQITLGNGSNDVLDLAARTFLGPGRNAVISEHAFIVYPISTMACGASPKTVAATRYGHDLAAMAAAVDADTGMVFIANPNNPTGTWNTETQVRALLDSVPSDCIVVLDEAYAEYMQEAQYPDGLALLPHYPNLIVTRTFSKIYGLAALRLGYAVSSSTIADLLNRVRPPFNTSMPAQKAAIAALHDHDYLQRSLQTNVSGRAQLLAGFARLNLGAIGDQGNFLTVDCGRPAGPLYEAMLHLGVITRPIAGYGLPNHLRISIGSSEENERTLAALATAMAEPSA